MKWQHKRSIIKELSRKEFRIEREYYDIVNGQHVKIVRYEPSLPPSTQGRTCIPMTMQNWTSFVNKTGKVG